MMPLPAAAVMARISVCGATCSGNSSANSSVARNAHAARAPARPPAIDNSNDSARISWTMRLAGAPRARRTPISRVRWVTDTSTVLVTTTIAASKAISEMGPAAAPIRCDRLATNPRAASGVSTSKVSGAPGCNARLARIEIRARPSASVASLPGAALANTCKLRGAPNARS